MADTLEDRIALVHEATGFDDEDRERAVLEHEGFTYGDRVRVIEDGDEISGPFEGAEGYIVISRVGAVQYGNERTALFFLEDGTDSPDECDPSILEKI